MSEKFTLDLSSVKRTIAKHLLLDDSRIIDVILAAHVANRFEGDPIWLMVIAPSSSAKTELLRSFDGHDTTYMLSNLTPSTLVSGMKHKKGKNPSLLPLLNDKTVIMKEFTTVLSLRHEQRSEILSQLREVFDGSYVKCFGTGLNFQWEGKVGLIAACTPVYDKYHAVISAMGDRFLIYRAKNGDAVKCAHAALNGTGLESTMRSDIREAVHNFIDSVLDGIENFSPSFNESDIRNIVNIASFVGIGRCPVVRDGYDQTLSYVPEVEGPGRLVKQLYTMAMAVMLINGKVECDEYVLEILQKIGRDLLPVSRLNILGYLWHQMAWETAASTRTTSEVAEAVNLPTNTAKVLLEDMMIAGALNRDRQESAETSPYRWQLQRQMCDYITQSGVFGAPF